MDEMMDPGGQLSAALEIEAGIMDAMISGELRTQLEAELEDLEEVSAGGRILASILRREVDLRDGPDDPSRWDAMGCVEQQQTSLAVRRIIRAIELDRHNLAAGRCRQLTLNIRGNRLESGL